MKPFKSIREGNSVEPGVSEINDVPEDPMSYVEIKPKKSKVVKEGTYSSDVERAFPGGKATGVKTGMSAPKGTSTMPKDKALQRAMTAVPKKPNTEYDRKVTSYLKKKYDESIDLTSIWENIKPEVAPVEEEVIDPVAHKKELDKIMEEAIQAHKAGLFEVSKELAHNYMVAAHKAYGKIDHKNDPASMAKKAKLEKGIKKAAEIRSPKPKPSPEHKVDMSSPGAYYASKKPGEYTGD